MSEAIYREIGLPLPYAAIDAFLAARGHSWRALAAGELPYSPRQLSLRLWHDDPALFTECTHVNRDDGTLWRLFDYQAESIRYRGHAVYRCAAEVGKTREVVADTNHCGVFHRGDQLLAAATDGALEDIWDELLFQASASPFLAAQWDEANTKVKPYRKFAFKNGNRVYLRPAAHDGRAFRGVHVRRRAKFDEAALIDNKRTWAEFFRACKEGCEIRLYSVPLSLPTEYSRIAARAPLFDPTRVETYNPRRFVLFVWSRPMMPPPHWSAEREGEMVELFGGRESAGYRSNVLALEAEPESTVFPRERFEQLVCHVPEYRRLMIVQGNGRVRLTASRLNPSWTRSLADDIDLDPDADTVSELLPVGEDARDTCDLDPGEDASGVVGAYESALGLLRAFVPQFPATARLVIGADLGRARDPSEVCVQIVDGPRRRWVLRLHLRGLDWRHQAVLYAALDELLGFPALGFGLDATSAGDAVHQVMRSISWPGGGHRYHERLSGFQMGEKVPAKILRTGEALDRKISRKELATRLLEQHMQERTADVPWDPDYLADFPRHTARDLVGGERKFSDINDHTIDAVRVGELRWYEVEHGDAAPAPPIQHAATQRPPDRGGFRGAGGGGMRDAFGGGRR